MAANGEAPGAVPEDLAEAIGRVADVMALTLVRRMEKPEKIRVLASLGYSQHEIAVFLDEKTNTVAQALSRQRRAAGRKPATRKPATRKRATSSGRPPARKRKTAAKRATTRRKPAVRRRSR